MCKKYFRIKLGLSFFLFFCGTFFFKSKKTEKKILSSFEAILPHPLQSVTWLKKKVKNEIYLEDKNVNRQIVLLLVKTEKQ